jgi:hypothetical protein
VNLNYKIKQAFNNAGNGNGGPVNEYEAQSAIIPFVGTIMQKEYELQQQCHFIFRQFSFRNENYALMRSLSCLCVCLSLSPPYQLLKKLVDFYELW